MASSELIPATSSLILTTSGFSAVKPTNEQDRDALAMLNRLVANGVEYPDAEWKTFLATGVPTSELCALYDNQ